MSRATRAAHSRLELGRTVRALRLHRGLTLRALADQLQVSPATVSAVENGRTALSAQRVAQLAGLLDVPVERMFAPAGPSAVTSPASPPSFAGDDPTTAATTALTTDLTTAPHPWPDGDWRAFSPLQVDHALAGALSAFLEYGYHGATMRTIAERAGLSVPGLYHYYARKQDMLVALLDLTMADLRARSVAAVGQGSSAVQRFCLLVECLALYHTHRRELGFVGASEMRSLEPPARQRVATMRREQQRMVDREVVQAVGDGAFLTTRPSEAARAVVTLCTALPQWFRADGPATAEQVAVQYVEFALDLVRWVGPRP